MLKLYRDIKNLSTYHQVLIIQALMYVILIVGLIVSFDGLLLFWGLVTSWLLFCIGGSVSLHRWCCHRSFEPKNKLVKWFLLWAGVQSTLGSLPGFTASHRQHHVHSDTEQDPFRLTDNHWHNFKLFWYHFPKMNLSPKMIVDILKDPDMKFTHDHYWKIWAIVPTLILLLGGPTMFVYFVALPITYMVLGMSWVTVMAHSKTVQKLFGGYFNGATNDNSWDSRFFTVLFAGEGLHNSHHWSPGASDFNHHKLDPTGLVIRFFKR